MSMSDGDFWTTVTDTYGADAHTGQKGTLRVAMLFAGVAIASAVILAPILAVDTPSARVAAYPGAYDAITTGSIPQGGGIGARDQGRVFTVRRSVLQDMPEAVCIIQRDGSRSGDC